MLSESSESFSYIMRRTSAFSTPQMVLVWSYFFIVFGTFDYKKLLKISNRSNRIDKRVTMQIQ